LAEKLNFKVLFLCWVPHTLINELGQKRVELARQLFRLLEQQQKVGFRDIVTGDESWFLKHYNHRHI
jgi:hypothetical protein